MKNKHAELKTIEQFFSAYSDFSDEDRKRITSAWNDLCALGLGDKAVCHCLRTAAILADSQLDADSIISALLHDLLEQGTAPEAIEEKYGRSIRVILEGSSRITGLKIQNKTLQQADSVRKMLFAMVDDIRVILVKMAERLDRLHSMKGEESEVQKALAQEALDIWAPLASRLGMSGIKDELEDLSLKVTNPDAYEQIKHVINLRQSERADYLDRAQKAILGAAEKAGIKVRISSRAKHFYSIYQKMRKRGKGVDEIFDLFAIRLICQSNAECYTLVGIVHNLWKPLEGRFKDYIAMPKANGYQSLHTTVMCDGMPLEIQIRTEEMHSVAEHGVASHWLYKKGTNRDNVTLENLSIINQLKKLRQEQGNDAELFNEIRDELLGDSIFVFTPKGDVRELPMGATAIDFAYSIHSHIGETIVGAKADGRIIPLSSPLENTQIIEILTNPQAHPVENQLQFVKTAKAKSKIKAYLLQHDPEWQPELKSAPVQPTVPQIQPSLHFAKGDGQRDSDSVLDGGSQSVPVHQAEPVRIRIGDTTNFLVKAAGCCNPVYGDDIIGYVSRGRGLIIHCLGCPEFARIPNVRDRTVDVVWEEKPVIPASLGRKAKHR